MDNNLKKPNIIAVDFDGTLCENKFPEIGEPNKPIIDYLKKKQNEGDKLILWTCRNEEQTKVAVEWCQDQGLTFDAINDNLPEIVEAFGSNCRKIFANEYIDDRNRSISSCREKTEYEKWAENELKKWNSENMSNEFSTKYFEFSCIAAQSAFESLSSYNELMYRDTDMAEYLLEQLLKYNPLTPVEDNEDIWHEINSKYLIDDSLKTVYQCKRMPALFKEIYHDGTVKYRDIYRYHEIPMGKNNGAIRLVGSLVDYVMNEIFPITMPYIPYKEPYYVYSEASHRNPSIAAIRYIVTPSKQLVEINRYFKKEWNTDYIEITEDEYNRFKDMDIKEEESDE